VSAAAFSPFAVSFLALLSEIRDVCPRIFPLSLFFFPIPFWKIEVPVEVLRDSFLLLGMSLTLTEISLPL